MQFAEQLLSKAHVAVVPGEAQIGIFAFPMQLPWKI